MAESGYDAEGLWSKNRWYNHINKNINRYDKGRYRHRNEEFIKMLKKHHIDRLLSVFEFAGSGGFLARMMFQNFNISYYLHTDYLPLCVEKAKSILPKYLHYNIDIRELDFTNKKDRETIDFSKFDLVVSTSAGYIKDLNNILPEFKKNTKVLISHPVGYTSDHMVRFPNIYELQKHYNSMEIMDIKQIGYMPNYLKWKVFDKFHWLTNVNSYRFLLLEKYVILGRIK